MQLSLFSVSYAGYWGQHRLDLGEFVAKAAALGYDSVMIAGKRPHLSPLDATPEELESIKSCLKKHQVRCGVIAGYTDLSPTAAAEVPYLEMQIGYGQSLSRIAAELGARVVRVFTAYETAGHSPYAIWNDVVSAIREMSDRAADDGVTIAVQNHHDIGVHTDVLLELINDIDKPNCKLGFDAWSPALRGEDLYEAANRMAPYTIMTTSADYVRLPRFHYRPEMINYDKTQPDMVRAVKFGEGFIDYVGFFQGLVEGGFDGIANFEMCSPVRGGGDIGNLDAYSSHYVRWMRDNILKTSDKSESCPTVC